MAVYTCPFDNLSVTTSSDQNVWQIAAPSTRVIRLIHFVLNSGHTADERVRLRLMRYSTAGSGGTGSTEVLTDATSATVGATVTQLVTTPGTDGDVLLSWYWSQLAPLEYLPVPETRIVIAPSGILGLHLETAVAAQRQWSGLLTWEEIG